ncbi:MAG: NAD-dependent epimerase/dehydratase family protein [Verrucomicrobia bacterium]|nr:NAD-dependent epimerase/dehydratase family protein [Verrucomicrobiota bacterium]MBS0637174.1 NAD-dependent epimerase/dehydratase family protein [Verrucomicrobiota bacterium]
MKRYIVALFVLIAQFAFCSDAKVLVLIPNDFVRNAVVLGLQIEGYHAIHEADSPTEIATVRPDYVIVDGSATQAKDGLFIDSQTVNMAYIHNVKKTLVLSSYQIYPENTPIPLKENALLNVQIETVTDPYQIAKITALKQCQEHNGLKRPRFIICPYPILTGPHDTGFNIRSNDPLKNISARILRAKWRNDSFALVSDEGKARYEFLHVDDLASAVTFLLTAEPEEQIINIGYGQDINIKAIAEYTKQLLKYPGELIFDPTCYDNTPRHVLDPTRLTMLGWTAKIPPQDALKDTVLWLEGTVKQPYNPVEETRFAYE